MLCLAEFSRYLGDGVSRENALAALEVLFGEDLMRRADEETCDVAAMMEKVFPRLQCYDCEHCELAGTHCEYPRAAKILKKIDKALEHSKVSQEELLKALQQYI